MPDLRGGTAAEIAAVVTAALVDLFMLSLLWLSEAAGREVGPLSQTGCGSRLGGFLEDSRQRSEPRVMGRGGEVSVRCG